MASTPRGPTPTSESRRPKLARVNGLRTVLVTASRPAAATVRWVRGVKCQMCSVGLSVHHRARSSRDGSDEKYGVENSTTPSSASSPRTDVQNCTGSGTCSIVSHAQTTSNRPASGASSNCVGCTVRS